MTPQLRFVRRAGTTYRLKSGRAPVMAGTLLTPLAGLGVLATAASGAETPWITLAAVAALVGILCFFVGRITVIDTDQGTVRMPDGRTTDKSDLTSLEVKAIWGAGINGGYSWARLIGVFRSIDTPVTLAEGRDDEQVEALGRELAQRLGAKWREPSAAEKARRRERDNVPPSSF